MCIKLLDKTSVKVLKEIKRNSNISLNELQNIYGDNVIYILKSLEKKGFIINPTVRCIKVANGFASDKANKYTISPDGRAYLEEQKDKIIRYWIPILISFSSFVISMISLIRTL